MAQVLNEDLLQGQLRILDVGQFVLPLLLTQTSKGRKNGMDFFQCITMCGGLALFLYGMNMLSASLKTISGGKLEGILERLTGNTFTAVLVGAVVTALIQSSSATTVIVVGLVNAKSLKLKNAVGVIMGANIGTTVTGQLLRMSEIKIGRAHV